MPYSFYILTHPEALHQMSAVIFSIGNVNMRVSYRLSHAVCEPQWLAVHYLKWKYS